MILVLDKNKNTVATLSNDAPLGLHFFDDHHIEKVVDFDSTYELTVQTDGTDRDQHLKEGNYLLLEDLDGDKILFKILEARDVRNENGINKQLFCENAFIYDLNNKVVADAIFTNTQVEPVLNYILGATGWFPELIEFVGSAESIEFTGYIYAQEALHQICETFACEVKFYVETVQGRIANYKCKVAKELGENLGVRIESGTGIQGIERKALISDIKTALIPLGATQDDGTPLTISSVNNGLNYVWDDEANAIHNPSGNGYLFGAKTNESITNPESLRQWGITELKKLSNVTYQYEIDILMLEQVRGYEHQRLRKGSYIRIIDHDMSPILTVSARIIEIDISYSNPSDSSVVAGDFITIDSSTPDFIKQMRTNMQNLKSSIAENLTYKVEVTSDNSTIMKNGVGTAVLTARVYKGSNEITTTIPNNNFVWSKVKNGVHDTNWENDKKNIGNVITVNADDANGSSVITCNFYM